MKKGDIFCTRNPMALGRAINGMQLFWSTDNESTYSHSGIIISDEGATFESLWTIKKANIDKYRGMRVLIGRHVKMTPESFKLGWDVVKRHEGQLYPFHRLILHIIPPMAKYLSTGRFPVCSELVAKFLCGCGFMRTWKGKNPDHIADMIRKWDDYDVVHEGDLE